MEFSIETWSLDSPFLQGHFTAFTESALVKRIWHSHSVISCCHFLIFTLR